MSFLEDYPLGIAILSCVVISSSVFAQDQGFHNSELSQDSIEPSEYADFAISTDPYTPFINEKDNEMIIQLSGAETMVASDESYILAPSGLATEKSPEQSITPSIRTAYLAYQVMGGETLSHIGAKFDVSSLSVLWANPDIKNPNLLQPGATILIPPRDGMTVVIEKGQSLDGLVKKYSGNFDETLAANAISDPSTVFAGQKILIAAGKPAKTPSPTPKVATTKGKVKGAISSATGPTVPSGTFIWPTSGNVCGGMRRGHPAIDICAGGASPPIVASDGGVVVQAAYGWNYGYGNTVLIDHGNGFQTRYGHMRVLNVSQGQRVSQGQQVGIMGTTGNSTGVHLHFEIHLGPARLNPLAYLH
ncbi:MAG: M23 family metallopeptidase [Candidatus Berkelbacteria bacterium]|nr:M23 family metallopeptidase [Candidatus Berkelbacteria bacterium]